MACAFRSALCRPDIDPKHRSDPRRPILKRLSLAVIAAVALCGAAPPATAARRGRHCRSRRRCPIICRWVWHDARRGGRGAADAAHVCRRPAREPKSIARSGPSTAACSFRPRRSLSPVPPCRLTGWERRLESGRELAVGPSFASDGIQNQRSPTTMVSPGLIGVAGGTTARTVPALEVW